MRRFVQEQRYGTGGEQCRKYNRAQLREVWPVSDMTVWRAEQNAGFPAHITINRRNFWPADEVDAWLAARAQKPRQADGDVTANP